MVRSILGGLFGAVIWFVVVAGIIVAIREAAPEVAAALNAHATVTALAERLGISFVATILGGAAASLLARERVRAPLATSVLLLIIFVPYHLSLWPQFPIWYHLTFFVSLPLLGMLGGRLTGR